MQQANRSGVMTLFSGPACPQCHRVRFVLAEKGVNHAVEDLGISPDAALLDGLNPYSQLPTLVDRELLLYGSNVILEYVDERYPHPPLMPVDPIERARTRLLLLRIDRDWSPLLQEIDTGSAGSARSAAGKAAERARGELQEGVAALAGMLGRHGYLLGDDLSMADCALAPYLWRLPILGVKLSGKRGESMRSYGERLFSRPAFRASLSDYEQRVYGH